MFQYLDAFKDPSQHLPAILRTPVRILPGNSYVPTSWAEEDEEEEEEEEESTLWK